MKKYLFLLVVFLVVFLFVLLTFSNSYSQTNSPSFEKLKELKSNNRPEINRYLESLPTDTLYEISELVSIENNDSLLYSTGYKIIQRIKNGKDVNSYYEQISKKNLNQKYLNTLIGILNASYRSFETDNLNNVFDITSQLLPTTSNLKSSNLFKDDRLLLLETNNLVLSHLNGYNNVDKNKVEKYCDMLQDVMLDNKENLEIRRVAIKGIHYNNYKEAVGNLLLLISDKSIIDNASLSKPLCLALSHFKEKSAFQHINYILENTSNESAYASAAIALGDLGGEQSLQTLVKNVDRFDSKYNEVAIRKLKKEIFDILSDSGNERLPYAIKATQFLYTDEDITQYKPLLKDLLFNTQNKLLVKGILKAFEQVVNKEEAGEIITNVPFDIIYLKEWEFINNIFKAIPISSEESDIPVNENLLKSAQGNLSHQEYGDAAYQDNNFYYLWGGINFKWTGHAGLYAGINSNHIKRQIAMTGDSKEDAEVRDIAWSNMTSNSDLPYWGTYTLNNHTMSFADRKDVINTAVELTGYDLRYPALGSPLNLWPDALNYYSNPGSNIDPYDVDRIRCDGVVEYCYEWNDLMVWGKNGSNYDISITRASLKTPHFIFHFFNHHFFIFTLFFYILIF